MKRKYFTNRLLSQSTIWIGCAAACCSLSLAGNTTASTPAASTSSPELTNSIGLAIGGTAAYGDRLVQMLNGFCTSDLVDKACEKTGKLGLQMHGGTDCEMFFKDFEVLPITDDMLKLIERK